MINILALNQIKNSESKFSISWDIFGGLLFLFEMTDTLKSEVWSLNPIWTELTILFPTQTFIISKESSKNSYFLKLTYFNIAAWKKGRWLTEKLLWMMMDECLGRKTRLQKVDGGWRMIPSLCRYLFPKLFFWEAHQQTWSDKPLAAPSQAHWQRACRSFTCTALGLKLDSAISFTALKFYFSVSEKEAKQKIKWKEQMKKYSTLKSTLKNGFWLLLSR